MPVHPNLEGRRYPAADPYRVGREKVREFARAVGATHPLHHDPAVAVAAGYADVVAPPTFPIVLQQLTWDQLLADPDSGIELARIVHGDQWFTADRAIVAGDELTAQLTVTKVRALGGNEMVTCSTAIADVTGSPVATAVSTLVVRGDA